MTKTPCPGLPGTERWRKPLFTTLAAVAIQFGLVGCVGLPLLEQDKPKMEEPAQAEAEAPKPVLPMEPQEARPPKAKRWEWEGDNSKITHIWVDVDSQKARFYEGNKQVGWTYVASGLKSHPTPVGHFAVMGKEKKKESNLYGKIYNADGQVVVSDAKRGRHQVPAGGRFAGAKMPYFLRLTGDGVGLHAGPIPRPGHPASHGCIRLPGALAERLFSQVPVGTPVTITGTGPDYGDYRGRLAAQGAARQEPAEGGTLSAAEVAKIQPASASQVQTEAVKPKPVPVIAAPTQTARTEPVKTLPAPTPSTPAQPVQSARTAPVPPRPAPAQPLPTVQTEPVRPRPTLLQPTPSGALPTEPLAPRSSLTPSAPNPSGKSQVAQPPAPQPGVARPQPPQNQTWKPFVTEGTLAVPVQIQPTSQARPPAMAQPGSAWLQGNPADKPVPPTPLQAGATQAPASVASPQAAKLPAASSDVPAASVQSPPKQTPEASAPETAPAANPSATQGGVQTAPAKASPGTGTVPSAPTQLAKPPVVAAPLAPPSATPPAMPPRTLPAEIKAPTAPVGQDPVGKDPVGKDRAEQNQFGKYPAKAGPASAPAMPLKAEPGEATTGG